MTTWVIFYKYTILINEYLVYLGIISHKKFFLVTSEKHIIDLQTRVLFIKIFFRMINSDLFIPMPHVSVPMPNIKL